MPVPPGDWTNPVIAFLRDNLPEAGENGWQTDGWDHMFSTAYQIGCMALVDLGQAEAMAWGAVPKAEPHLPAVLPLWEDICVAVLWLAEQQDKIVYPRMDGGVTAPRGGDYVVLPGNAPPQPVPNIAAGRGTGPAVANTDLVPVLAALGLIKADRWTPEAEAVHLRSLPQDWRLDFEDDDRFDEAVELAMATMPPAITEIIAHLMRITGADVDKAVAESEAALAKLRVDHGPNARIGAPATAEQIRRGLPFRRENELDWLFFRHWRLAQGWLSADDTPRALEIFHDRLAIAMRKAVVARLYPGGFVWA